MFHRRHDLDQRLDPLVKRTVCYIVCAVTFNDKGQVLMIQEAKRSCRGQWYLPAGRVEPNEDLLEAVRREVLEEAGLSFEPDGLLCVEAQNGLWYRFTFTGAITGGELKTTEQADKESLQAAWIGLQVIKSHAVPIRSDDILTLLDLGAIDRAKPAENRITKRLPCLHPVQRILLRVVYLSEAQRRLIISLLPKPHLPVAEVTMTCRSTTQLLTKLLQRIVVDSQVKAVMAELSGVLHMQHNGKRLSGCHGDGLLLTVVVKLAVAEGGDRLADLQPGYEWSDVISGDVRLDCLPPLHTL